MECRHDYIYTSYLVYLLYKYIVLVYVYIYTDVLCTRYLVHIVPSHLSLSLSLCIESRLDYTSYEYKVI